MTEQARTYPLTLTERIEKLEEYALTRRALDRTDGLVFSGLNQRLNQLVLDLTNGNVGSLARA